MPRSSASQATSAGSDDRRSGDRPDHQPDDADSHHAISKKALLAGKHVYCEKPLGVSMEEAEELMALAHAGDLRLGCAPDTFLGGGHQLTRRLLDEGRIGKAVSATAMLLLPGHEHWHPNPAFFYDRGGGPMLDVGPYYVTNLIALLGPVREVFGTAKITRIERTVKTDPRRGEIDQGAGADASDRCDRVPQRRDDHHRDQLRRGQAQAQPDRDLRLRRLDGDARPQQFHRQGRDLPRRRRGLAGDRRSTIPTRKACRAISACAVWARPRWSIRCAPAGRIASRRNSPSTRWR